MENQKSEKQPDLQDKSSRLETGLDGCLELTRNIEKKLNSIDGHTPPANQIEDAMAKKKADKIHHSFLNDLDSKIEKLQVLYNELETIQRRISSLVGG